MLQLSKDTIALLEDIERRIDPETEEDFAGQWRDFLYGRFTGGVFTPQRRRLSAPQVELPPVNINDAVEDMEQMLVSQMQGVSAALNSPDQNLCIRANYGTGILSSLFGAQVFTMPRSTNTLPTTRAFNDTDKMRELLEQGAPDLTRGFGSKVFAFGELCAEVFARYPKIGRYVEMYHPDTQGPLDICELMWGGEMFYAMYDEPELVHAMLRLVTDTYTRFLKKWYELYPCNTEMNCHWVSMRHRGAILLRDDSAMNLSPAFYEEFAAPYDGELLQRFGGGAVHFCGRGDHYIPILSRLPGLYGINMSQPHLNDMETIYCHTVDKGIPLLAFPGEWAQKTLDRPGQFHHNLHSSSVITQEDHKGRKE